MTEISILNLCGMVVKNDMLQKLEDTKRRDRIKNRLIRKHIKGGGADIVHFIRFNYKEDITEEFVIMKLLAAGVTIPERKTE
jgi:hypothetical protein